MMLIPTRALPNQTEQVQLGDQAVTISLRQERFGLYADVYLAGVLVAGGVLCQCLNRIVRAPYTGFVGDLIFADLQGSDDPIYTGLGSRFVLLYLEAADIAARGL
jgi:hypothetical protein